MVHPIDAEIRHVSDTALWVAAFRALEGGRADAAFHDPLAAILSGERGRAIAHAMPRAAMVEWSMIVRTSAIDHLINEAVSAGVDTILNLGAGLDTRPYRLALPETLRWIELDFPSLIELKNTKLVGSVPSCQVERVGVDLLDRSARAPIIARHAANSQCMLFITEGVLPYMSVHDASVLATDLLSTASPRFWIQDFDSAGRRRLPRGWDARLAAAPFLFEVENWFEFFERYGWRASRVITNFDESRRIKRSYPLDFPFGLILRALPKAMREKILNMSGAVLMHQIPSASATGRKTPSTTSP